MFQNADVLLAAVLCVPNMRFTKKTNVNRATSFFNGNRQLANYFFLLTLHISSTVQVYEVQT